MILKIKKPDYLGDSKWQFKHGKKTMEMKILDDAWLNRFRMKQVTIAPGDSLRAIVKSEVKYDFSNDVISEKHEILKMLGDE